MARQNRRSSGALRAFLGDQPSALFHLPVGHDVTHLGADAGVLVKKLCRRQARSDGATVGRQVGGMEVSDAKRLEGLEAENANLNNRSQGRMMENEVARRALRRSGERTGSTRAGALDETAG